MEIFAGFVIAALLVTGGLVFILRRGQLETVPAAAKPAPWSMNNRRRSYEFTTEPVSGLGQLVAPRWSTRRRHIGVVSAMRNGYCRVALVNRAGYEPKRVSYRIGSLRRVATTS